MSSIQVYFVCVSLWQSTSVNYVQGSKVTDDSSECFLSSDLIQEIASYQTVTNRIVAEVLQGSFKGRTYNNLAFFLDKYGHRFSGTQSLERSINFMLRRMRRDGLTNVHGEKATVPRWVRGDEEAELISPLKRKIAILGLGYSVGTLLLGISAETIVVRNFTELKSRANEVRGKIVVFNQAYGSYETVKYRYTSASEVAKLGGVAALVRSITDFSIYSPHTGILEYEANVRKIPSACITVEDAEMLQRMNDRKDKIVIRLRMQAGWKTECRISTHA